MKANITKREALKGISPVIFVAIILLLIAVISSALISAISWILFSVVSIIIVVLAYHRIGSLWRKYHFALLFRSYAIEGYVAGLKASNQKIDESIDCLLLELSRSAYPSIGDNECAQIIFTAKDKMKSFVDGPMLMQAVREKLNVSSDKISELNQSINNLGEEIKKVRTGTLLRYVIAEFILRDYNEKARFLYMYEVLINNR